MPETTRPRRWRILDELGRERSLAAGPECFRLVQPSAPPVTQQVRPEPQAGPVVPAGAGSDGQTGSSGQTGPLVLLGLGPDLAAARAVAGGAREVFWLDCPDFAAQMPDEWHAGLPPDWRRIAPEDLPEKSGWRVLFYAPGERLFSTFWGPILARLEAIRIPRPPLPPRPEVAPVPLILLPGEDGGLLTRELEEAARDLGFVPFCLDDTEATLHEAIERRPRLLLSVNLRGLDVEGRRFRLLQACGVPIVIWFVDNPWHILSALRQPWWREAHLCVTDASFMADLRRHGARSVQHLPLGAWHPSGKNPASLSPNPPKNPQESQGACPDERPPAGRPAAPQGSALRAFPQAGRPLRDLVFVGRSAFPDRDRFFAGQRLPPDLWQEAERRLVDPSASPDPPHIHWWRQALKIDLCWPGFAVRQAGLGAELSGTLRRALWLRAVVSSLTLFGDAGWAGLLPPPLDLRPPVSYYDGLFSIYAQARWSLNVTSLHLPCGLTQRHFDVWMAGGFLLSDAGPGLSLFPPELTRPIAIAQPSELPPRLAALEKDPALRPHLIRAWQDLLTRRHTYAHRLQAVIEGLPIPA